MDGDVVIDAEGHRCHPRGHLRPAGRCLTASGHRRVGHGEDGQDRRAGASVARIDLRYVHEGGYRLFHGQHGHRVRGQSPHRLAGTTPGILRTYRRRTHLALRTRTGRGRNLGARESWDISTDHQRPLLKLGGLPQKTESNMAKTLDRIAELTETPPRA